jgi:hypothetical protein
MIGPHTSRSTPGWATLSTQFRSLDSKSSLVDHVLETVTRDEPGAMWTICSTPQATAPRARVTANDGQRPA